MPVGRAQQHHQSQGDHRQDEPRTDEVACSEATFTLLDREINATVGLPPALASVVTSIKLSTAA
jgi:hypothetical protein